MSKVVSIVLILERNEGFSCEFGQAKGGGIVEGKLFTKVNKLSVDDIDLVGKVGYLISRF